SSRSEALFSGEVDEAVLHPSQQKRVSESEDTELLTSGWFPEMVTMMFNTESEYLTDPAVRRAIFAAIDRDAIAETALAGVGVPAHGFVPEAIDWAVNEDVDFAKDF